MRSIRKIIILACLVSSIIAFWLIPGVNTAKETHYTRIYEDTDNRPRTNNHLVKRRLSNVGDSVLEKTYKKETIHSKHTLKDIKPSMYSRAMQFSEDDKIFRTDTSFEARMLASDTLKVIQ